MRVIVCGGRTYNDKSFLDFFLDSFHSIYTIDTLIQGGARGADSLANEWAKQRNIQMVEFPAKWKEFGKIAGILRNLQMVEEGYPDYVVAFPGGKGTGHMVKLAKSLDIPYIEVEHGIG